jgi:hypothetical protein
MQYSGKSRGQLLASGLLAVGAGAGLAAVADWLGLVGMSGANWQICAFASAISLAVALGATLFQLRRTYTERRLHAVIEAYADRELAREALMRTLGRARSNSPAISVNGLSHPKPNGPTAM